MRALVTNYGVVMVQAKPFALRPWFETGRMALF
jgi:hypothetical protein